MPEPARKGRRAYWRGVLTAMLVAAAMLPVTIVVGALLTPTLWRLEPVLGLELAGHSGPADWILWVMWAALTAGITTWIVWRRYTTR